LLSKRVGVLGVGGEERERYEDKGDKEGGVRTAKRK
jgi:hypothetical protein